MIVAIDVGSYQIRSLRRQGGQLRGRRCRTLMSVLPDTPSTIRVLHQSKLAYATAENSLLVLGDQAAEMREALQAHCLPLLPEGQLSADDPLARQALAAIVDAVLPDPNSRADICCLTCPAAAGPGSYQSRPESEFLKRIVRLRGYSPQVLTAGAALCLAELVDEAFTGIGLSFGAATCEASVCHRGREIAGWSIPIGADQIDQRVARELGELTLDDAGHRSWDLEAVRRRKTAVEQSLLTDGDETLKLLAQHYREWIRTILGETAAALARCAELPLLPQPMSLVIGGGCTALPGFQQMVGEAVRHQPFPVTLKEIRVAEDVNYAVARGCLIAAELEAQCDARAPRAA